MTLPRRKLFTVYGRKLFTVYGQGIFPIDMLRYDSAWPYTEADARKIQSRAAAEGGGYIEIQLLTEGLDVPSQGRWQSFGWKVIAVK